MPVAGDPVGDVLKIKKRGLGIEAAELGPGINNSHPVEISLSTILTRSDQLLRETEGEKVVKKLNHQSVDLFKKGIETS
ncbi:hypothetical protein BY996DRAFT_6463841 [Phakopsora pachyrhizi]|nr:hypothetical protein BY996DRAFT_6463841 [Phakopsora pachyrhizi]